MTEREALRENDPVAVPELAAVLGVPEADIRALGGGPFVPDADDCLRLRVALGAAVLLDFATTEVLPARLAPHIAVEAANGAVLGGDMSSVVVWRGPGKPAFAWFDGPASDPPVDAGEGFGSPLRRPMVIVPASQMFTDLAHAVTALRQRRAGVTAH